VRTCATLQPHFQPQKERFVNVVVARAVLGHNAAARSCPTRLLCLTALHEITSTDSHNVTVTVARIIISGALPALLCSAALAKRVQSGSCPGCADGRGVVAGLQRRPSAIEAILTFGVSLRRIVGILCDAEDEAAVPEEAVAEDVARAVGHSTPLAWPAPTPYKEQQMS